MIKLYNDDCIKAIKLIEEKSVDLVITDPPYNLGSFMKKRQTNLNRMRENFFVGAGWDNLEYKEWYEHMDKLFKEMGRVSKIGASMLVFMSLIRIESIIEIAEKHGFYYKTTGIWHKTNPMPRNMNLHFINSVEGWIYFTYKKRTGTFNNENKAIHDFIETSTINKSEKTHGKHPTQKPEKLIEFFIKLLSNENDVVLDPFMGSGTSGAVATKLKRRFIGIELLEEYFRISHLRIKGEII
ncbi:MAG: DNA-methyltransferase [Fusobacteriaceae bacterium]